jgi:hypothetical protein
MLELDIEQVNILKKQKLPSHLEIWHIVSIDWVSKWQKYAS